MDRYADGDDAAFGELYDALAPLLMGFLRRNLGNVATAEDLLQQTFLHLHRGRSSFIRGAAVTPWAFAIARRLLLDKSRHDKIQVPIAADQDPAAVDARAPSGTDEVVHARRMIAQVSTALAMFREDHRIVFELVRRDGLSLAEVADILDISLAATKSRMHRTLEYLRGALGAEVEGMEL